MQEDRDCHADRGTIVTASSRILLAVAVVAVDLLLFALPLTGLLAAWVLITRPPWFRSFVDRLYANR